MIQCVRSLKNIISSNESDELIDSAFVIFQTLYSKYYTQVESMSRNMIIIKYKTTSSKTLLFKSFSLFDPCHRVFRLQSSAFAQQPTLYSFVWCVWHGVTVAKTSVFNKDEPIKIHIISCISDYRRYIALNLSSYNID